MHMPDAQVRPLRPQESGLLREFVWEAIHVPPGQNRPPLAIVDRPELAYYWRSFGRVGDSAVAAEVDGEVIGVAWVRVPGDQVGFGTVDRVTPELAISLRSPWRGQGIGSRLLERLLTSLAEAGQHQVSLSVAKTNPARRLYERAGFVTVADHGEDLIMVAPLGQAEQP
jgi:ribosomal protein S18 acetylase RimI-like enzyme